MHELHDEDLILELLDAAIHADEAPTDAAVMARLDNCETCTSDFVEQREMIRHLTALPRPMMSADERTALHMAVDSDLDAAVVTPITGRRSRDWTRLGTVAAALVGVVAVAGLLSSLSNGTTSLNDSADTTGSPTAALTAQAANQERSEVPAESADDGEASDAAESGLSADTSAIAAPSDLVRDVGSVNETMFESELDDIRSDVANLVESSGILERQLKSVDASCIAEVPDQGTIRAVLTATVDGTDIEVYLDVYGEEFGFSGESCSPYDLP